MPRYRVSPSEMDQNQAIRFRNYYACPECGHKWHDDWSCTCNDHCPNCGLGDIEPYKSKDM